MQVQHESRLIEAAPIKLDELAVSQAKSLDDYTLAPNIVTPIDRLLNSSSSPNLIATYHSHSNQIILFDTKSLTRRDRFPLKACDKSYSKRTFVAKGLDFSPDGQRIAVGQSDSIVYIYKLPSDVIHRSTNQPLNASSVANLQSTTANSTASTVPTSSKPTITGKFVCSTPVTCLIWTECGIIFGTQDGKVKLIHMAGKSAANVADSQAQTTSAKLVGLHSNSKNLMPISLCYKANVLAVGLLDNSVLLLYLPNEQPGSEMGGTLEQASSRRNSVQPPNVMVTFEHSCPAQELIMIHNNTLCCAGSDGRLAFHNIRLDTRQLGKNDQPSGKLLGIEWKQNIDLREDIIALDYSQINEILVALTRNRVQFFKFDAEAARWRLQNSLIEMHNLLALTSVTWTRDGSQLALGSLSGSLDLFRCSWSKQTISDQLDICHIAKNRVRVTDRARNLLATFKTQHDIKRVNLLDNGQSVIVWTTNSLLLARMGYLQSEIAWNGDKNAKFAFGHPGFVVVYKTTTREMLLVKLGLDSVIFRTRLELIQKDFISVRQFPSAAPQVSQYIARSSPDSSSNSPSRQRSAGSARPPKSQRQRQHSQHGECEEKLAIPENQLEDSCEEPEDQASSSEPQCERLVYVSDKTNLILIDLMSNNRRVGEQHSHGIRAVHFSHTGRYLVFLNDQDELYILFLDKQSSISKRQLVIDSCHFVAWIPETDILVAQSGHHVHLWFELGEQDLGKVETLDSRSYGMSKRPPILDLSLLESRKPNDRTLDRKPYPIVTDSANDVLLLSNKRQIILDKTKVRFQQAILGPGGLMAAYETLTASGSDNSHSFLWTKLAWQATRAGRCDIAIKSFSKLGFKKLVKYLEACQEEEPEARDLRLNKLLGDWLKFERTCASPVIISTYKRLNKWTRLIAYLTETQQFRQRDLVEQEQAQWLASKGRLKEAAKLQSKLGDIEGALKLLESNGRFADAVDLIIEDNDESRFKRIRSCTLLVRRIREKLEGVGEFRRAAIMCDKILDEKDAALELYLRSKQFNSALELVAEVQGYSNRRAEIELAYGDHLMEQNRRYLLPRRQARAAVDHFISAGQEGRALEAAIELHDFDGAYKILNQLPGDRMQTVKNLPQLLAKVASHKKAQGKEAEAIKVLMLGEQYDQVVDLYCEQRNFTAAFEVALRHIYKDRKEASEQFIARAKRLASMESNGSVEAEQIYLMLDEPDLAIEMHRQLGNYERMLELTEQQHPDLLEASLLQLAKDLETAGEFEAAEKYLLRASPNEWTNVVRMYRLAGRWADAYRVARANCASEQDPLLIQLAFWWSKSLVQQSGVPAEAHDLLKRLGVLNQVVEFCCENKNFQFALELCGNGETSARERKREVLRRYAALLEQQHKFVQAEEVLVRHGQVELAARMYIDNDMHTDAIRVVEEQLAASSETGADSRRPQLVELLNETLIQCANKISEDIWPIGNAPNGQLTRRADFVERLQMAQQMYLRAQRPDLAVDLYKQRGLWQEAVQVAQRFAPKLLESVERALDKQVGDDLGPIVAAAAASRSSSRSSLAMSDASLHTSSGGGSGSGQRHNGIGSGGGGTGSGGGLPVTANGFSAKRRAILSDQCESSLARLEWLSRRSPARDEISNWLTEIRDLSDLVSRACCWTRSCWNGDELRVWLRLRDLLTSCLESLHHMKAYEPNRLLADQLDLRMTVAHLVTLHGCLVQQLLKQLQQQQQSRSSRSTSGAANVEPELIPSQASKLSGQAQTSGNEDLVELICKLSLSLLRYAPDLIEPKCAYYSAGFWLLVGGRRPLVRLIWARLLELIDNLNLSRVERELKLLDLPTWTQSKGGDLENIVDLCGPDSKSIGEVRAWLLSAIIDGNQRIPLDERGLHESSLGGGLAPICLVSGLAVFGSPDQLILGDRLGSRKCARLSEWRRLLIIRSRLERNQVGRITSKFRQNKQSAQAAKLAPSVSLDDIINYIRRLTGYEGA